MKKKKKGSHTLIKYVDDKKAFSGVYYLVRLFNKVAKNGNDYADLLISDKSGKRYVRFWNKVDSVQPGDFVEIKADVSEYDGKPQITARSLNKVDAPSNIDDYIIESSSKEDSLEKFINFVEYVEEECKSIGDYTCKNIIDAFMSSSLFEKFKNASFPYVPCYDLSGGLIDHTVKVTGVAMDLSNTMGLSDKEIVIVITAGLLHAIGCVDCYEFDNFVSKRTSIGILAGSYVMTINYLFKAIRKAMKKKDGKTKSSKKTAQKVLHVVASHSSRFNGEVRPSTKEALVFAEAYGSEAILSQGVKFIDDDENNDFLTAFDAFTKRRYYKK